MGAAITVTIEDGTDSGKKYTVDDGSGGIPEVYDNTDIMGLKAAVASSQLVDVQVNDTGNEPDNTRAANLVRGTPENLTRCSLVERRLLQAIEVPRVHPIEVTLQPGILDSVTLPRYVDMRVNLDQTVQIRAEDVLTIAANGHPMSAGSRLKVSYSAQGYNAGTTEYVVANQKDAVCSIDDDPTSATLPTDGGASAELVQKDICRFTFTLTDPLGTYNDYTMALNFVVATEALTYASTPTLSYGQGAKLKIGVATPLTPAALPNATNATVVWKYVVTGYESDGSTLKKGVCRVDERLKVSGQANPNYGKLYLGEGASNQTSAKSRPLPRRPVTTGTTLSKRCALRWKDSSFSLPTGAVGSWRTIRMNCA